ncbi:FAD binding monooxygenase [Penicillium bovifimosum]|uniref:FAD binding monooxygenase n=1 Tax=Penicillium bovifimosum TaxID=126998 RepID=A0A9W9H7S3_9EURO|nr:FAD binding monooxygenase [Penicillium bovifimosum]KAJ5139324.1 FAD binding monooxygenase [Penicillium bovifimosum]
MDETKFTVIIVGGSIAGLSLAHCLQRAGIECTVLEKRAQITAHEGASVGIMPNGGRILKQLGMYDAVEKLIEPMRVAHVRYPDGFHFSNPYPEAMHEAFGFPMAFISRQALLHILYHGFPDKSKIHVGETVVRIDHHSSGVQVHTRDGRSYKGDLIVGADGVHSCVRTQMWHLADTLRPGTIPKNEKNGMTVSYACIFGISTEIPGLDIGNLHISVYDGKSFIIAPGLQGQLSWFVVLKLDKTYAYGSAPRFSSTNASLICEQLKDMYIWKDIQFSQIWERQQTYSMTPLEENIFQNWHFGRMVCIGDSMHKMTPNLAQGANCAIEDAASLANVLYDALKRGSYPHSLSDQQIDYHLSRFNKLQVGRMAGIYKASRMVVKLQTRDNLLWKFVLRYYVPYSGNDPIERAMEILDKATALTFIPLPQRSGPRWMISKKKKETTFAWPGAVLLILTMALLWYRSGKLQKVILASRSLVDNTPDPGSTIDLMHLFES